MPTTKTERDRIMQRQTPPHTWHLALALATGLALVPAFLPNAKAAGQEPWVAPPRAARRQNPVPADEASVAKGKALYIRECLSCHGPAGKGDGPAVKDLDTDPGDLTSKETRQESDGALFWKITEGRKPMPAFQKLTDEERWNIVNYLRSLAPAAAKPAQTEAQPAPPAHEETRPPAQQPAPADKYVTREEYEKVLKELAAIKAQLQGVPAAPGQPAVPPAGTEALQSKVEDLEKKQQTQRAETDQSLDELDKRLKDLKSQTKAAIPGSDRMLLSGFAAGTFQASHDGYAPSQPLLDTPAPGEPRPGRSSFSAVFSPIFLWKVSDKLFFEGEFDAEINSLGGTDITLEFAQVSYVANDYVTFGAGKFLNPINYFVEQLHPLWINKLPNGPLAVFDGLLPESIVGAQLHGATPLGPTKIKYSVFTGNAPSLDTQPVDDSHAGLLNFEDRQFAFSHITVGGHVGFLPIPDLELGYGIQGGDVGPEGGGIGALWQSVDLNYVHGFAPLKGVIDLKAQWVWSNIDPFTVDPTNGLTHLPAGLNNDRNGGYVQLAYRPTMVHNKFLKNFELVVRYDRLNQRDTPIGFDEHRWAFGLDYWLSPRAVFKAAYETDHQNGLGQDGDAFLLQFALGF
jgi:mono/diheme cytochrome c family protein